jgi:hypothetical protein
MKSVSRQLKTLQKAVLDLNPTGPDGFEGLVGQVLGSICGCQFRLASSGSQRGRDGGASLESGDVYFEAKRYEASIPRPTLSDKIVEVTNEDVGVLDLWILAATVAVSEQHASHCRRALERTGIGFLLLDWADEHELPLLPLALAMGHHTTARFLGRGARRHASVARTLAAIRAEPAFPALSEALALDIGRSVVGLETARRGNEKWLNERFADRVRARAAFGQRLAPFDLSAHPRLSRPQLAKELRGAFDGPPSGAVFAVLGDEGVGKSWLIPETWASLEPRPLLIVATADSFESASPQDIDAFLIDRLVDQSGPVRNELSKKRWARRLKAWRAAKPAQRTRLTLFLDGLNQAPSPRWPAWIDAANVAVESIGGQLIFTTRTAHFERAIRRLMGADIVKVHVSEWSDAELDELLLQTGVVPTALADAVRKALRNPRLLGLAIELLGASAVESIHSLSVERLLFEYLSRADHSPLEGWDFSRLLSKLGESVFKRMVDSDLDDLRAFDVGFDQQLRSVIDTRFFQPLSGESGRYEIREDGLSLALGLWLLETLRKEERNKRDPSIKMDAVLEPLSALDMLAEVLWAAVEVATHGEQTSPSIISVLLQRYAALQNLDRDRHRSFSRMVHAVPEAFLLASRELALHDPAAANAQLIFQAVETAGVDGTMVTRHAAQWLAYYSLLPNRRMFTLRRRAPADEIAAERTKLTGQLQQRMANLAPHETSLLTQRLVQQDEGDLDDLHRIAMRLLAGRALAPAARALVGWCFGRALNGGLDAPLDDFGHLVRLNRVDWSRTRQALLDSASTLRQPNTSPTGQWALVYVLRATGDARDGDDAEAIAKELTKDRESIGGWRRVEQLCDTDPCDPHSAVASNIHHTAEKFSGLDVTSIARGASMTESDAFLREATPGLARFAPAVAVGLYRRLAGDVSRREGDLRRWGVLQLASHTAALEPVALESLVTAASVADAPREGESGSERDEWLTAQYSLLLGAPHLSGDRQLALIAKTRSSSLILPLLELMKPATPAVAEEILNDAVADGDVARQRNVLAFLQTSATPLTDGLVEMIASLMLSKDRQTRFTAIGVAAVSNNEKLIRRFSESAWTAVDLEPDNSTWEKWWGSMLLIAGAERGHIGRPALVDRIGREYLGLAAARLEPDAAEIVAGLANAAFEAAFGHSGLIQLPHALNRPIAVEGGNRPPLMSLGDQPESQDPKVVLREMTEPEEEHDARQARIWRTVHETRNQLYSAGAWLAFEDIGLEGMRAIARVNPAMVRSWLHALVSADESKLASLHAFGLELVAATFEREMQARVLLQRLLAIEPLVHRTVGPAEVPFELTVAWSLADDERVKDLCFERLDRAANDHAIAVDVLAAHGVGKQDRVLDYVRSRVTVGEPWAMSRALMVAGFSEPLQEFEELIDAHSASAGFCGTVAHAAKYAYERNVWALEWYRRMQKAETPVEFWRCAILLTKIVDARFTTWPSAAETSATFDSFRATLKDPVRNRIKGWARKRGRTLFGGKVPDRVFIQ